MTPVYLLIRKSWVTQLGAILFLSLLLSTPSLINQFPFIYYDSGFYILHGAFGVSPWSFLWRPLTYSLLLGPIAQSSSLLQFVILQSTAISAFLFIFLKQIFPEIPTRHAMLIIIALFLTPLPLYANFILPDVFSGLLAVLVGWVLLRKKQSQIFHSAVVFLLAIFHHSNMLVMIILSPILIMYHRSRQITRTLLVFALLLPWLFLPILHGYVTNNFTVSNVSQAIIFSRLMTHNVAHEYLDRICQNPPYPTRLCEVRDKPFHIWHWDVGGQIGSLGGISALEDEFRKLNKAILTTPDLVIKLFFRSIKNVTRQIFLFSEPLLPIRDVHFIEKEMKKYSLLEARRMNQQQISDSTLSVSKPILNFLYWLTTIIGFGGLAVLTFLKKLDPRIRTLWMISCLYYLTNALVCGALTDPLPRYSARIIWIFFFLLTIQVSLFWMKQKMINRTKENA